MNIDFKQMMFGLLVISSLPCLEVKEKYRKAECCHDESGTVDLYSTSPPPAFRVHPETETVTNIGSCGDPTEVKYMVTSKRFSTFNVLSGM